MEPKLEQRITTILDKIDLFYSQSENPFEHQERFYRLFKKRESISKHAEVNVSAFEINEEENESKKENSSEIDSNEITMTSRRSIRVGGEKVEINDFVNLLEKELNELTLDDNNIKEKEELSKTNSPKKSETNKKIEKKKKKMFEKYLKVELILKSFLDENKSLSSSLYSNKVSQISSSSLSKINDKTAQTLPNIVINFCREKQTIGPELENLNKRFSLMNQNTGSKTNTNQKKFSVISISNKKVAAPSQSAEVSKKLTNPPKDVSNFNISFEQSSTSSINDSNNELKNKRGSLWSTNVEPIEERILKTEEDEDIDMIKDLCKYK